MALKNINWEEVPSISDDVITQIQADSIPKDGTGRFRVTLDTMAFTDEKPNRFEIGGITNRMVQAGETELDKVGLWKHIKRGKTFCCGCFETGATKEDGTPTWGAFKSMQLVALDFDNKRKTKDANGKDMSAPLWPGEAGYIGVNDAWERCVEMGLEPLLWYYTMSNKPEWERFRLVIDLGEPITDKDEAAAVIAFMLQVFPEADQTCRNVNRLYFGANASYREGVGDGE